MLPWGSLLLIAFIHLIIPLLAEQAMKEDQGYTTFVFDGFNGSHLFLGGGASVMRFEPVLALTNHSNFISSHAVYSIPVQMKSNETVSSFSTTFVFSMVPLSSVVGAHGIAFVMMPNGSPTGALPSQFMGLLNVNNSGQASNHLFAVEFDTAMNVEFKDPDGNHVGVDINNLMSVQTKPAGYWNEDIFHGLSLKSGRSIQAWIDYNHPQSRLDVTIMLAGLPRPQRPLISLKIDLRNVLKENMFIGFSADTGVLVEDHYVLA